MAPGSSTQVSSGQNNGSQGFSGAASAVQQTHQSTTASNQNNGEGLAGGGAANDVTPASVQND